MFYLLLLTFSAGFISHHAIAEYTGDTIKFIEYCAPKVGISADKMKRFNFFDDQMPETEEELSKYKCFFKCMLESIEMIDSTGKINSTATEIIFDGRFSVSRPCVDVDEIDTCDKAFEIMKCITLKMRAGYIIANVSYECDVELEPKARDEVYDFFINNRTETNDENVKCYLKCVYQKLTAMDENGNLVAIPKYKEAQFTIEQLNKIKPCFDVTGKDLCEKAYNFYVCKYTKID